MSQRVRLARIAVACVLLLLALVGISGPGHILPQYAEGRLLFSFSPAHGLTELDVVSCELIAVAGYLLYSALRPSRPRDAAQADRHAKNGHPSEVEVEDQHPYLGRKCQP